MALKENPFALPEFDLPATNRGSVTREQFKNSFSILYFYPRDDTPGCTREAQDFRDHYQDFQRLGAQIWGISRDTLQKHEKFREKYALPFDLISDQEGVLCEALGVLKEKKLYGKLSIGIERSTFLVDPQAIVQQSWRRVKVDGHINHLLAALSQLQDIISD